jgi:hypothetical protein
MRPDALCRIVAAQKIGDQGFWAMVVSFSENGGTFVSDNIISDEIEFQRAIPDV